MTSNADDPDSDNVPEPGTIPLRPVVIVAALLLLAAAAYTGYACFSARGNSSTFTDQVASYPPDSVTYIAQDHSYLVRTADASFLTLSEVEAQDADRVSGCIIRYRPDLSAGDVHGVFRDDCLGTLFNRMGIAVQGSAPPMQRHPTLVHDKTVTIYPKACEAGGNSMQPEACRE
ncbi:MAG: hypothetical protein ACR2PL_09865 [Dehalococcoidia bacterium]